jgi:formylglycine-generating enzyme required for sulfatase activity
MKYKAFISYKHSENGRRHAQALETALKRYAKPTLSRPMRIFRDEKHMKPDISLPRLIREGLDNSEYLIFLAERSSASSPWCCEELAYWCGELQRSERLIIVLVDDEIISNGTERINFELSTALPRLLEAYITTIPLYTDFRWAKTAEDISLQNTRYRHEINALSARLRGVSPEDLNDEEIRVFRRNIRLRNGAIGILTGMLFLSVIMAVWATKSARVATEQREIAEKARISADSSATVALAQQKIAEEKTLEAEAKTIEAKTNLDLAGKNLQLAQAEEARARAALAQVEKEKVATEKQRIKAEEEKERAEEALADIRKKNRVTFETFASLGKEQIYTLDHTEALEKMQAAVDVEVDTVLKRQQLTMPVCELLYFFAEGGRRPELARKAAELLLGLQPDAEYAPALRQCLEEAWGDRRQFAPLLAQLPFFLEFQQRYYPEMVTVPLGADGVFKMGSSPNEWQRRSNEQLHEVKLSAYQIAATPTTFYQYALYSEAAGRDLASRTPYWGRFGDHPVVHVSWYEAAEYANWLNAQQGLPPVYQIKKEDNSDPDNQVELDIMKWKVDWNRQAKCYRLPTEAEWELAARGGVGAKRTVFAGSKTLSEVGWYWENSGDKPLSGNWDLNRILDNNGRTHPVKTKKDNGIGVFDMSGNVWEWCWDWYNSDYYDECKKLGLVQNPPGPGSSSDGRVIRGGGWNNNPEHCRVALRVNFSPADRNFYNGFRLVFVP